MTRTESRLYEENEIYVEPEKADVAHQPTPSPFPDKK